MTAKKTAAPAAKTAPEKDTSKARTPSQKVTADAAAGKGDTGTQANLKTLDEQATQDEGQKTEARAHAMTDPTTDKQIAAAIEADPATAKNLAEALDEGDLGDAESERSMGGVRETMAMKRAKGMGGPPAQVPASDQGESEAFEDDGSRVRLVRVDPIQGGSLEDNYIDVHPSQANQWAAAGWKLDR